MLNAIASHGRSRFAPAILPLALGLLLAAGCASTGSSEARANEADERLRYGRYDEAAAAVEPVVQKNPGDWRAQFAYGRALLGQGKLEDARRALDRAYRLQPSNEDVCIGLAECMAAQKDVKDSYQLLRAFGKDFRSWRAYLALSRIAEASGDPDTAATSAVDAIKVNEPLPGQRPSIEPYMRAADLSFRFGRESDGIRRLRQAYGILPDDPRIADALAAHNVARNKDTAVDLGP
ncbi:MAG: tetratricopeptide repeat protein [Planctomycetota bacterium]|jgi:tetratricopeptide (TPR) repeat protein